jgi:probable F420-dependent oxidoreductase
VTAPDVRPPVEPALRGRLGRVGVWTGQLDYLPGGELPAVAAEVEQAGYGALWTGEAVGREVLTAAQLLLSGSTRLVVATGIANVWARDALAMAAGQLALAEAFPGRFLLGLGVSHAPLLEVRGQEYGRPLAFMRSYLAGMDQGARAYRAVRPAGLPPRVLAALGPRMQELAAELADGVHSYFVPPEHTAEVRSRIGPDKLLAPEQAVVLDRDPAAARALARRHTGAYLRLPNYVRNLERFGFGADDFTAGGSDRLVDAIVAWGAEDAVGRRVQAHLDAGADHVCIQVLDPDPRGVPRAAWQRLASVLPTSS